tara:strand:- start:1108 stop:1272 length:165 start_codon:yes stop_codon:yes gene_type:complete
MSDISERFQEEIQIHKSHLKDNSSGKRVGLTSPDRAYLYGIIRGLEKAQELLGR